MSDDTDYLDENGNDLRYGHYLGGAWRADPSQIIELKKSGKWDKMAGMGQRWALENYLDFDPVQLDLIWESTMKIKRQFAQRAREREEKLNRKT
ncbi:MAG: hypothetical protein LBQ79_07950 [Deltaproteobacteria bacterium]|jgi:hypothetical protein|nr:hypothetical protein [Deltaproteobacteria bacterium]